MFHFPHDLFCTNSSLSNFSILLSIGYYILAILFTSFAFFFLLISSKGSVARRNNLVVLTGDYGSIRASTAAATKACVRCWPDGLFYSLLNCPYARFWIAGCGCTFANTASGAFLEFPSPNCIPASTSFPPSTAAAAATAASDFLGQPNARN